MEPLGSGCAGHDEPLCLGPLLDFCSVLLVPLVQLLEEVVKEVVGRGAAHAKQADVSGLVLNQLSKVSPQGGHLDLALLVVLPHQLPEPVARGPLCPELCLRFALKLLLLRFGDPLLPRGERFKLREPLEGLVIPKRVLNVAPSIQNGQVIVLCVHALDLLDVLLPLLPPLLTDLLLVLIHEVLEKLVALLLLDELEEVPVVEGLRDLLVAAGDFQLRPLVQGRNEVVLGTLPLLPFLLLFALLLLRHKLCKDLLPLTGGGQGIEAPVVLDELQGLLPLHRAPDSLLLQELAECTAALLL
mmetsp:Transcript_31989/g.72620  ORF Transcript_31989/g.72620 Transcript_31989/m.72620 type:complete len:300 (-) Transcript_31989:390-1289(-)